MAQYTPSPELQAIIARQMARNEASRARFLGAKVARPAATIPAPMPAWQPTGHGAQPEFGKLPIDRLTIDEAEAASNRNGRAGLQAYLRMWNRA